MADPNPTPNEALTLTAQILTAESYRSFGDVLTADSALAPSKANRGTADMYGRLTEVVNLRPGKATQNWKIYRCVPCQDRPVRIAELEKHPASTQLFSPMGGSGRYLIVVALGTNTPDLDSCRAFIATNRQAITYHPGIWHLPMTVLDGVSDMLSLIYEDGSPEDCIVADHLSCEIRVNL